MVNVLRWRGVEILGLVFAGTATDSRLDMAKFVRDVLGLPGVDVAGASADMFDLPDGSRFAISGPREMGETSRTIGFLVADLDVALAELHEAGVWTDGPAKNELYRYAHFCPPDGQLYELVEQA
jgi:catechol 2,3-dioxygenase-like lactoylglutathione lyase family enzyme